MSRKEYFSKWYSERKSSRICVWCDSPAVHHRTMCLSHLRDHQRKQAERRRERRQKGMCDVCGLPTNTEKLTCEKCRQIRLGKEKARIKNRKINNQCIECKKPKSDIEVYQHCDDCRLKKKIERQKIRQIIFDHYGQKCNCPCGCNVTNPRHLTLDHIENNGAEHRREVGKSLYFYRWVIRNNFPEDLQILCFNCNCAKAHYGGCSESDMTPTRKYAPKAIYNDTETPVPEVTPTHPNFI